MNFIVNHNRLTGTFPRVRLNIYMLRFSGNMLEGSIPELGPEMTFLDMSDICNPQWADFPVPLHGSHIASTARLLAQEACDCLSLGVCFRPVEVL